FIPYPVTTGFTAGISVTIISSQLKDFFGIRVIDADGKAISVPAEFVPKLRLLTEMVQQHGVNWSAAAVGVGSLAVLILLRKAAPRVPGAIVAVVLAWLAVRFLGLDKSVGGTVETIGSRFGGIPHMLPSPHLPRITFELVKELIPSATTIAMLCAIE